MPYLNLEPNYFDHPKTRRLVAALGATADIFPIRLWAYCAKHHPEDGRLKGYSAVEVESIIGWNGAPNDAIAALARVGFILESKEGFSCVDWKQHEGHLAAFSRRGKAAAKARWAKYATSIPDAMQKGTSSNAPSIPAVPALPAIQKQTASSPPVSEPALIVFPTVGKDKAWNFTQTALDGLKAAFPSLEVAGEARKALAWLQANPTRRKTPTGMAKFLFAWMERTTNRGGVRTVSNGRVQAAPGKYDNL